MAIALKLSRTWVAFPARTEGQSGLTHWNVPFTAFSLVFSVTHKGRWSFLKQKRQVCEMLCLLIIHTEVYKLFFLDFH